MSELDPCVFCGSPGELEPSDTGYTVFCQGCGMSLGCPTKEEAIEMWNYKPRGYRFNQTYEVVE